MPIPNARQVFFPFNLCTFPVWKWLWVSSQCYKGIHLFVYVTTSLGIWHQSVSERFVWRTALIVKLKVCNVFVFNCISVQSSRETETEEPLEMVHKWTIHVVESPGSFLERSGSKVHDTMMPGKCSSSWNISNVILEVACHKLNRMNHVPRGYHNLWSMVSHNLGLRKCFLT